MTAQVRRREKGHTLVHRVTVVGAGIVGLSCAWFLQERGVEVTVLERDAVCSGSSWGNAGWLAPALTVPLPEPSVLRYGLRAMLDPKSPLYVPPRLDPNLWSFLLRFAAHCTETRWARGMAKYRDYNREAFDAYDQLVAAGIGETRTAPIMAGFSSPKKAAALLDELRLVAGSGQPVDIDLLTADEAREAQPLFGENVAMAVRLKNTRFIFPAQFVARLADAVRERGGVIREKAPVREVRGTGKGAVAVLTDGDRVESDDVVLANGAWLSQLARAHGVKTIVRAGRGYSFTVATEQPPTTPVYLPEARVACTPTHDGRLRVAGMMEFRRPDDPLDPRRINAIVESTRRLLRGIDWSERRDEWVGSRPVTPNGLPLIGQTRTPHVYVAGGHGMWGITLGPLTGRTIADQICSAR